MALVVMLTIAAFADGIRRMGIATTDRIWIETWRTFAYMMSSRVNAAKGRSPPEWGRRARNSGPPCATRQLFTGSD
jgi:hypothetical protein